MKNNLSLRLLKIEKRVNRLYNIVVEKRCTKNERSTTSPHEGDLFAFNIATKFNKDDVDIDSEVDVKNKKDAWTLRLVYNDSTSDELSLVKLDDNKDDFIVRSNKTKDNLNVKFTDNDKDDRLKVPQEVIDHITKHISDADDKIKKYRKNNDKDLAKTIAFEINKNFSNYKLEVIEGDVGKAKWNIEIIYKDGSKDMFTIIKVGASYLMSSKDSFIAKYSLEELKNFPKNLADHIKNHAKKSLLK